MAHQTILTSTGQIPCGRIAEGPTTDPIMVTCTRCLAETRASDAVAVGEDDMVYEICEACYTAAELGRLQRMREEIEAADGNGAPRPAWLVALGLEDIAAEERIIRTGDWKYL